MTFAIMQYAVYVFLAVVAGGILIAIVSSIANSQRKQPYQGPQVDRSITGPCISSGGMCYYTDDREMSRGEERCHEQPVYETNRQGQLEEVGSATGINVTAEFERIHSQEVNHE